MTDEPTMKVLLERARELDIEGRSNMSKPDLEDAIERAEALAAVNGDPPPPIPPAQQIPQPGRSTDRQRREVVEENVPPSKLAVASADGLVDEAQVRANLRARNARVLGATTTTQED